MIYKTKTLSQLDERRETVRIAINKDASFTTSYMVMNVLATIVACYGLIANSTAVVIGAMLIAMLMGPITGAALALVDGNNRLLGKAFLSELAGVVLVLSVAFLIGRIYHDVPLGSEVMSRTAPNILDLMIALAGGAAGAYATVSRKLNSGLIGVAIATALVPPLSACSLLLARGETRLALGAFLLFFTNFVAIQFASSLVLWLHGYHHVTRRNNGLGSFLVRQGVSAALLAVLTVGLGFTFKQTVAKQRFEARTRDSLQQALRDYPGTHLADLRFEEKAGLTVVTAVVRTPVTFNTEQVRALESRLSSDAESNVELLVRSVVTIETTRNGGTSEVRILADPSALDAFGVHGGYP